MTACGGPSLPSTPLSDAGSTGLADGAPTGQGAGTLNVTQCDPKAGWRSAVRSATGVTDAKVLASYALALKAAGYHALYHGGADAGTADAGAEPDAGATDDAAGADTAQAGPPADDRVYVAGMDPRNDGVFLLPTGDLLVTSACPLDRLGQVRRLDFALAAAARVLTAIDHPGDWHLETDRWTRPAMFYGARAGQYWRQYLSDSTDLQKPLQGTLALAARPDALAFGLYGHADVPSSVGDVVRMNALTVGGKKLAVGETWPVHDVASVVWDLAAVLGVGDVPFTADLLVADASVEWNVGVYRVFFEALFPDGPAGLGVATQGPLPGALRISHAITELDLPAAPTRS